MKRGRDSLFLGLAVTLHNLEEAIWLPAWSATAGKFHPPISPFEFGFAVTAITVFVWAAIAMRWRNVCVGIAVMMMGNLLFPHLLATLILGRYAPGLATSILFVLPAGVRVVRTARQEGMRPEDIVKWGIIVSAPTIAAIPVLKKIGAYLSSLI